MPSKEQLLALLAAFVRKGPNFQPADFATHAELRAAQRTAARDLHDAESMLAYLGRTAGVTAADLTAPLRGGRRLTLTDGALEYRPFQRYSTEFRCEVANVLADVIWSHLYDPNARVGTASDLCRALFGAALSDRWFT